MDETRDLLGRTSQLCGLSDRYSFPLMVFCSGCIFLTIAASFSRSHHLTGPFVCSWTFAKGPCWSWAFLWGTFSRLLQWFPEGLPHTGRCWGACSWASSCLSRGIHAHEVFCLLDFPLRLGYLFYLRLLDASLILLQKPGQFKNRFSTGNMKLIGNKGNNIQNASL